VCVLRALSACLVCRAQAPGQGAVPAHDLTASGMSAVVPTLSDPQYPFQELVGQIHDGVILSGDALRSLTLEDAWCE
jgi:hypothetical protein